MILNGLRSLARHLSQHFPTWAAGFIIENNSPIKENKSCVLLHPQFVTGTGLGVMKLFRTNIFIATESLICRRVSGNCILNEPRLYVISSAQFKNWSLTTFFISLFSESRIIRLLGFFIINFINITESKDNNNCVQGYFCLNPIACKLNAIAGMIPTVQSNQHTCSTSLKCLLLLQLRWKCAAVKATRAAMQGYLSIF